MTSATEVWFDDMDAVEAAFDEAGFPWMQPRELAFFNSVVLKDVYGGRVFVSSERMEPEDEPSWHVRLICTSETSKQWNVEKIGVMLHGLSAEQAKRAARILAEAIDQVPLRLEYGQDVALEEWLSPFVDVGVSGGNDGWRFSRERGFERD